MTDEPKPIIIQERHEVCELDRERIVLLNPALFGQKIEARTIDENAKTILRNDNAGGHRNGLGPLRNAATFLQVL